MYSRGFSKSGLGYCAMIWHSYERGTISKTGILVWIGTYQYGVTGIILEWVKEYDNQNK